MNTIIQKYLQHLDASRTIKRDPNPDFINEFWENVGLRLNNGFVMDDVTRIMIMAIFKFPEKGCHFFGSVGIGKTLNLDIFAMYCKAIDRIQNVENWEVSEFEMMYRAEGGPLFSRVANADILIMNDVGAESELKDFGTERNLILDLLTVRYRKFQREGKKTYITSNLKPDTLFEKYGSRVKDRFKEMFTPVELTGQSRRK